MVNKMFEETLIILKPDCLERNLEDRCLKRLEKLGEITLRSKINVSANQIMAHYEDNLKDKPENIKYRVLNYFVNKEVIIILLKGKNVIANTRKLIGTSDPAKSPKGTIRGDWGIDSYSMADASDRSCYNIIHASDSEANYIREKKIWVGVD